MANRDILASKENKAGTTVISKYAYTVNALGQRTNLSQTGTAFATARSLAWGYDSLGQVTSADSTIPGLDRAYPFEYDPFGKTTVATGPKANDFAHRFSTKPLDATTGLYYYGLRYYDPNTGRWPSRDPIGERGGVNLYGFGGNDGANRIDRLGAATISITHMNINDILRNRNVLAYTGATIFNKIAHAYFEDEQHIINETNENGKCCAEVKVAATIGLDVTTVYPYSKSITDIMTSNGYQAMVEHEGRRQYAYVEGKKKLLTPISGTGKIATRCGKICSKGPGSSMRKLKSYLDTNQKNAMDLFNSYQDKVQIDIDKENDPSWWLTKNGKFDGFTDTVNVDFPPNYSWEDCPKGD